jgi:hypothetical protein
MSNGHHSIGDNIITRGLAQAIHNTLIIRGFHALRVFASKGFYPIWKLFGRGRLEGKIELVGTKSFTTCEVYRIEGTRKFDVEKIYTMMGMRSFSKVNESVIDLEGSKTINVNNVAVDISGTKLMKLSESVSIVGKKDLSPILAALDII